jgi:hypothetical protein
VSPCLARTLFSSADRSYLVYITEVGVLLISQILEGVPVLLIPRLVNSCIRQRVSLLVLVNKVEAQAHNDDDKQAVAAKVRRESDEVAWAVPAEKNLRSCIDMSAPAL